LTTILGIETSCDETSASVITGRHNDVTLRSLVILSQDVHRIFGGVVPELASRAHLTAIVPVVERALADASCSLDDIDAVGVTHAPGLVGALLVGVCFAKAIAFARGIPVVGVHHLEGHLFAQSLEHAGAVPPFTALLVSGGHTLIADVPAWGSYQVLGRTRDDAAGEAFDKVGKLLGLPYPGGPYVERLAREASSSGTSGALRFARPMLHAGQRFGDADYFDMSFSGLKTAVRRSVESARQGAGGLSPAASADLARAFQDALVDTLVEKTARAALAFTRTRIILGGGVACNQALTNAMRARAGRFGAEVFAPSPRLATDNAAMIARAALYRFETGDLAALDLNAYATRELSHLNAAA
jgi:N6-L-threonylcarbamoyladenine synthase